MWTRPDAGDCPVSYPAPTYSAAKGIFESILWIQAVEVVPTKIEVCSPAIYHGYNTNYGGPLRKGGVIQSGGSYQLLASVVVNPCYRLYADVRRNQKVNGKLSERTRGWERKTTSPEHAYQEMFNRRLRPLTRRIARSYERARIETNFRRHERPGNPVSPARLSGRGLKRVAPAPKY